ncbi:MAG: substrate-binding domain-containing protein [Verrucomicrobia bacterium]|jgi:LacI family transcriptional regulator|nr:substrate-binding domain-containing protein [Verrucomicrobiota bacterium]MBT7701659.1 substrate-binding domain-containing protein [Verrucomicrobiota bacterium]
MTDRAIKRVLYANAWWNQEILNGTMKHAAEHGWHLNIQPCLTGELPRRWNGDGIITLLGDTEGLGQLIESSGCPVVSLNANYPELHLPTVSQDSSIAGSMAAEHFLERGFTSFVYYSAKPLTSHTETRFVAFQKRLHEAGKEVLTLIPPPAAKNDPSVGWEHRGRWLEEMLPSLPKPVAIFAYNDQDAVELIEVCIARSISVPDEIAVLGMHDMPLFRHSAGISLSSVSTDRDQMTKTACDLLADLMDGSPAPDRPILLPPTGVAARASTDTLAASDPRVAKTLRFMIDHHADTIGLTDFVRVSGVCKTVLYEAFNRELGRSPYAVLSAIRFERAKRMLRHSNEKLRAVAYSCGFGTPENLFRCFKLELSISPGEYRKRSAR